MLQKYKTNQVKPLFAYGQSLAKKPIPDFYYSGITTSKPYETKKLTKDTLMKFPSTGIKFVPQGVIN